MHSQKTRFNRDMDLGLLTHFFFKPRQHACRYHRRGVAHISELSKNGGLKPHVPFVDKGLKG